MHKKIHLILALVFFVAGATWANSAFAAWTATVHAEGQDTGGTFEYDVEIITLECDPDVAAKRNVHGVPRKSVLDMYRRLTKNRLPPFWDHKTVRV